MTSYRKIRANRENAGSSTGPKTAQGRARAARNPFRHGLSLSVYSDPAWSEEVEALAREIVGTEANAEIQELARPVAEAQIDLRRVRYARHQLLSHASDPDYLSIVRRPLRGNTPEVPLATLDKFVTLRPDEPHKFAAILAEKAEQLLAMDRYERRALSRRKFAVRAFDAARRQAASARA